jgi:hypothetical protein
LVAPSLLSDGYGWHFLGAWTDYSFSSSVEGKNGGAILLLPLQLHGVLLKFYIYFSERLSASPRSLCGKSYNSNIVH